MKACLLHDKHRLQPPTSRYASPPSANHRPSLSPHSYGCHRAMVIIGHLYLRRARATNLRSLIGDYPFRSRSNSSYCASTRSPNPMASSGDPAKDVTPKKEGKQEEEAEKKSASPPPLPPPPEMPLPGDCCGSGCVRCVWDVYYEELEAYNNSLRERDASRSKPESS